jgi:peptidoglycan/xylan/chitin deacetylase (PgdA/CDA1 family)
VDECGIGESRRTFLAGALGAVGMLVAGCADPTDTERATTAPSSSNRVGGPARRTPGAGTTAARPGPTVSSVQPGPTQPTPGPTAAKPAPDRPATARDMAKRATVPVLCYHQLRNWRSGDSAYNRSTLICPPKYFRRHLDAIADGGWTTITPDQYLAHLTTGAALPKKPVMLSFDDASAGQASEGLPQLVKRGMTGTFFVMTVVLDKPQWMSTRDVKRLAHAGMTIGSHTWDHHAITDLRGRDWKIQLEQSRETLRKASGQSVRHFAYPYGVVATRAYEHLKAAGYSTAFQLASTGVDPRAPLYTLRRSIVVSTWSGATLLKHLAKHHS